ncbi:MAG TPA: oxaloacetate decarboxylase [Hyphomicrobiales bacterium]|nr:oxaloacetate decarboxylase [Hyphomicrobiales bacterium]
MTPKSRAALKAIVARREAVLVPGAANALFARIIEELGFEAAYITGAGIANMQLGVPDIGLTTLTEVANTVAAIADAVEIPLIVDADTGFGNELNVTRTVRLLERCGAAAIQLEDQVFPKKCGHFSGKEVIPLPEMIGKLKAALDARHDPNLQIVARTDARATDGLGSAIERAQAFAETGADIIFVEAPSSLEELETIAHEIKAPQIVNIVFGGKTPDPGHRQLKAWRFSIALYANAALQAALKGAFDVLSALKRDGALSAVSERLASFEERQRMVRKDRWDALENRLASKAERL